MRGFCRQTLPLVALALAGACHESSSGGGSVINVVTVHGSGSIVEEVRAVAGFTSLIHMTQGALYVDQASSAPLTSTSETVDGVLRVAWHEPLANQGAAESLVVRAEGNLLPYLLTEVNGSVLELRTASGVDLEPTLPIEFFLTVLTLEGIAFQGVGSMHVDSLTTNTFGLDCSGLGQIELSDLEATELDVVLGGIGNVRVSGNVDQQTVQLSGLGPYQAEGLQSREADVLVGGFGSATVRVSELLIAVIESSGSVFYIGNPAVQATIHGTGTVEQIGR